MFVVCKLFTVANVCASIIFEHSPIERAEATAMFVAAALHQVKPMQTIKGIDKIALLCRR